MIGKLAAWAAVIALAYWVWTGPLQERRTESMAEQLKKNAETMAICMKSEDYRNATGAGSENPERACAERHGLYFENGKWYSYAGSGSR